MIGILAILSGNIRFSDCTEWIRTSAQGNWISFGAFHNCRHICNTNRKTMISNCHTPNTETPCPTNYLWCKRQTNSFSLSSMFVLVRVLFPKFAFREYSICHELDGFVDVSSMWHLDYLRLQTPCLSLTLSLCVCTFNKYITLFDNLVNWNWWENNKIWYFQRHHHHHRRPQISMR